MTPQPAAGEIGERADGPRFLLYSHDGFGLGHLQRNLRIARRLARELPGASALLLAGSPHAFGGDTTDGSALSALPSGVDLLKLPSIVKVGDGRWEPRSLRIGREALRELRTATIHAAVEAFAPDLLLVDFLPTGVWGELLPALAACRRGPRPTRIVLGLRDVLDTPEATRQRWREEGAYEALATFYDEVLVYGSREIFPTAALYGIEDAMPGRIRYCGYLVPDRYRGSDRADGGESRERRIVVAGGGGADAYPLMRTAIEALGILAAETPELSLRAVAVTGPLLPEAERQALRRQAAGLPVEVWRQAENFQALLASADLVVSMGGYNTVVEALGEGCRLLVVPRPGPSAEQAIRAETFARLGLLAALPAERLSAAVLAEAIQRNLGSISPGVPPSARLPSEGLATVARTLAALAATRFAPVVPVLP
jgi:predicted glycosyltransferase